MATKTTSTVRETADQLANKPKPPPVKLSSVAFSYAVALLERGADKDYVAAHKLEGGKHNGALNELSKKKFNDTPIAARKGNGGKGQAAKLGQIRLFVTRDQIVESKRNTSAPDSRPAGGGRTPRGATLVTYRGLTIDAVRRFVKDFDELHSARMTSDQKALDARIAEEKKAIASAKDHDELTGATTRLGTALAAKSDLAKRVTKRVLQDMLKSDVDETKHDLVRLMIDPAVEA